MKQVMHPPPYTSVIVLIDCGWRNEHNYTKAVQSLEWSNCVVMCDAQIQYVYRDYHPSYLPPDPLTPTYTLHQPAPPTTPKP